MCASPNTKTLKAVFKTSAYYTAKHPTGIELKLKSFNPKGTLHGMDTPEVIRLLNGNPRSELPLCAFSYREARTRQ